MVRDSVHTIRDVCRTANSSVNEAAQFGCRSYTYICSPHFLSLSHPQNTSLALTYPFSYSSFTVAVNTSSITLFSLSPRNALIRAVSYPGALRRNKGYESRLQPPYENNISRCSASGYVDCSKVRLLVCCQPHYIPYDATAEQSINFGSCCIRARTRTYNLRRFGSVRNSAFNYGCAILAAIVKH